MGDNFFVKPGDDSKSRISQEGIVSGEIGEASEPIDPNVERLRLIEIDARKDAILANIFDETVSDDPGERAAALLDRINAYRRELDRSDLDAGIKRERDLRLSEIANRLRELL